MDWRKLYFRNPRAVCLYSVCCAVDIAIDSHIYRYDTSGKEVMQIKLQAIYFYC